MSRLLQRVFGRKRQAIRSTRKTSRPVSMRVEELEMRALMSVNIHPVPIDVWSQPVVDGNFSAPALASGTYQYNPTGTVWSYYGPSGVSANGSGFTARNPSSPSGAQVGFVQKISSIDQTVDLSAGTYSLSMLAAQRANVQSSFQAVAILVDNRQVGVIVPAGTSWHLYQTPNFTVAKSGPHSLIIQGLDPTGGDNTAFMTEVEITNPISGLPSGEPGVMANAMFYFNRDGSLTYQDMLTVLSSAAGGGDMRCLQTIVRDDYFLTPPAVGVLASKVVYGDPANATYEYLDSNGNVLTEKLGNLTVGSSRAQLQKLINKWFLGIDYPTSDSGHPYHAVDTNVPLTVNGFNYYAVRQGGVGDCWLMASLAEVAARSPGDLQNMFTYDGTNTVNGATVGVWTVRFFHNMGGNASRLDYVTVDTELPDGGYHFANITHGNPDGTASTELWAALAEKAYAEENESGWIGTGSHRINSYQALDGGWPAWALTALTGTATKDISVTGNNLASAWNDGKLIVLGTRSSPPSSMIVGDHAYALVGYNSSSNSPFTVYNPWGLKFNGNQYNQYDSHYSQYDQFSATATFLAQNFDLATRGGAIPSAISSLLGRSVDSLGQRSGGAQQPPFTPSEVNQVQPLDEAFATVQHHRDDSLLARSATVAGHSTHEIDGVDRLFAGANGESSWEV